MPKLSDIADEVGVSSKTVSITLRGKKCASEETTRRIFEVAERTGYLSGQAQRVQDAPFIGFLADMVATSPHTVDLVRGAQNEAIAQGRHLLIGTMDSEEKSTRDILRMFRSYRASGVIYATLFRQEVDSGLVDDAKNVVYANCFPANGEDRVILPDDEHGGYQQAAHLLKLGHKRIAVITLPEQASATSLRLEGISRAFGEQGMVIDPALCCSGVEGYLPVGENYVAYERAKELLEKPDRPTAIICGNDRIALMVYSAATHLGLRIPQDISVVGFDDFQTISEFLRPQLTTVALPYFEMGRRAVSAILYGTAAEGIFDPVSCKLIERDSCAPPSV